MYEVVLTEEAQRVLEKLVQERGKSFATKAYAVLDALSKSPRTCYRAHPLHGNRSGFWGCHITGRICFVYEIDGGKCVVTVVDALDYHKGK